MLRLVHGGVRVAVGVEPDAEEPEVKKESEAKAEASEDDDSERTGIDMWVSCAVCRKRSDKVEMNDGA